jgi:hypothetical protein
VDVPALAAGGLTKSTITTGRLGVAVAETDYVPPSTPRFLLQLGAVFSPITDFAGNPHWVGTGVNDVSVNYAIKYQVAARSGGYGHLEYCIYVNKNTLVGSFEVHVVVDGVDTGALMTITAGATGTVTPGTVAATIVDGSRIELKLTDSAPGPHVTTSGTLDIRATFWGKP